MQIIIKNYEEKISIIRDQMVPRKGNWQWS